MKNILFLLFFPYVFKTYSQDLTNTFKIGQSYGGGIIFYIDTTGIHGLIVATNDLDFIVLSCGKKSLLTYKDLGTFSSKPTNRSVGSGQRNTYNLVNYSGEGVYSAFLCYNLFYQDYSDWFLPSIDELNLLFKQKKLIGEFSDGYYESSTENIENKTLYIDFTNGTEVYDFLMKNKYARPIRAF